MRRPFSVTILLWLVLSLTVWSGLRLVTAIQWWRTLLEFASSPGPLYIAISGVAWLVAGIGLLWGIWQAKTWARVALLGAGAGFTVWNWSDRLLLQSSHANWLFTLAANFLLLIVLSICIFLPATKTFFMKREAHDR
jgi:hypothetical protein